MAFSSWNNSIFVDYNKDVNGNILPQRIQNEYIVVQSESCGVTSQIPYTKNRIIIDGFQEVYDQDIISEKQFKVIYGESSLVFFHPSQIGKSILIKEYYGIGQCLIDINRIMMGLNSSGMPIKPFDVIKEAIKDYRDNVKNDYDNRVKPDYQINIKDYFENDIKKYFLDNIKNPWVDVLLPQINKVISDYINATNPTWITQAHWTKTITVDNTNTFQLDLSSFNPVGDQINKFAYQSVGQDGAIELIEGEHWSRTGATINLLKDLVFMNGDKVFVNVYRGMAVTPIAGTNGGDLQNKSISESKLSQDVQDKLNTVYYENTLNFVATVNNTTQFTIADGTFNPETDKLKIYQDNMLIRKDDNYTLNGMIVTLAEPLNIGDKIYYEISKNSVSSISNYMSDGSLLGDGSISKNKLTRDLQDELTLATSQSAEKVTIEPYVEEGITVLFPNIHNDVDEIKKTTNDIKGEIVNIKVTLQKPKFPIQPFEFGVIDENISYFNVERYGAKNDGVTDCTDAIQNAIKSAINSSSTLFNGNCSIVFGKGDYLVNGTVYINLPSWHIGVTIKGNEGKYNMVADSGDTTHNLTRITKKNSGTIFKVNLNTDNSAFAPTRTHGNILMEYVSFYCPSGLIPDNIVCEYFRTRINVKQVNISNFKGGILSVNKDINNVDSYSDFCIFDRVYSSYARGTQISTYMNDNGKVVNCQFSHMDNDIMDNVVLINGGSAITVDNNIFTQAQIDGKKNVATNSGYIKVTTVKNIVVTNTYCERIAMENAITLHNVKGGKVDGVSVQHQNDNGNGNGVRVHSCKNIDISRIQRADDLKTGYYDVYEFGTNTDCFVRVKTCCIENSAGVSRELKTTLNIVKIDY